MHSRRHIVSTGALLCSGLAGCSALQSDATPETDEEPPTLMTVSSGGETWILLTYAQTTSIGAVEPDEMIDGYHIVVDLSADGRDQFVSGLKASGAVDDPQDHPLRTQYEGEVVWTARLGQDLADAVKDGSFTGENFLLQATERATAEGMKATLERWQQ